MDLMVENPYTGEEKQWLPPFCPHCGADMYGNNEDSTDGWIKCEDRLPEVGEEAIVWMRYTDSIKYNTKRHFYSIGFMSALNDGWRTIHEMKSENFEVIAWKPISPPSGYDNDGWRIETT